MRSSSGYPINKLSFPYTPSTPSVVVSAQQNGKFQRSRRSILLRLRAIALALRGAPTVQQFRKSPAVIDVIDRRYSSNGPHKSFAFTAGFVLYSAASKARDFNG